MARGVAAGVTHAASFAETALAELPERLALRYTPAPVAASLPVAELCRRALAAPIGAARLDELSRSARRIAVIVSDASRDEPRAEMLRALREVLPWDRVTLVVASGTHAPTGGVIPEQYSDRPCVVHDASDESRLVELAPTERGTRVRLLRDLVEADLVVATGRIRPHYFAGYSGGLKSIFPGCAHRDDALTNHRLKADVTARLGRVEGNVCRADMEAAARSLAGTIFLLNVLSDVEGTPVAAAAGDPIAAHRELLARARELFLVRAPRASVVVVADRPPVSSSLYQASKLLPPAGAILEDGGVVVIVADCRNGTGPLERVNRGIYELGVRPQLPARHRVLLVSELSREIVASTYAEHAPSLRDAVQDALAKTGSQRAVVLWRAGELVCEAS